ncbi:MAG: hypothetical protein HYU31_19375 [Deltaproteobacteria bacterium]|nr:hypothetical protein [Deltaproteobacteria bacterium]MBI2532917.1 hypothetical protein [Deltaproteobacteria bacterium]MBI3066330.1 hypothetical protein [Deltaproteobacteria bacterium]
MTRILAVLMLIVSVSPGVAQSDFYQSKTITVVAGANAGSTYDFLDDRDYQTFIDAVAEQKRKTPFMMYAYCLCRFIFIF